MSSLFLGIRAQRGGMGQSWTGIHMAVPTAMHPWREELRTESKVIGIKATLERNLQEENQESPMYGKPERGAG